MIHIPILSLDVHARRSCSTTGEGDRERGHSPQPLARRGGCRIRAVGLWRRGMSVLPGGPGHMQELRMQPHLLEHQGAPGFCPLHHTLLSCLGDTRARGTSGVITCTQEHSHTHTHEHLYPTISQSPSPTSPNSSSARTSLSWQSLSWSPYPQHTTLCGSHCLRYNLNFSVWPLQSLISD